MFTDINFNSILVRLKPTILSFMLILVSIFQFHSGTIKASSKYQIWLTYNKFQFHSGTIKA